MLLQPLRSEYETSSHFSHRIFAFRQAGACEGSIVLRLLPGRLRVPELRRGLLLQIGVL
jgi:hypothetical protein